MLTQMPGLQSQAGMDVDVVAARWALLTGARAGNTVLAGAGTTSGLDPRPLPLTSRPNHANLLVGNENMILLHREDTADAPAAVAG